MEQIKENSKLNSGLNNASAFNKKVGDGIEKAGDRLNEAGFATIGDAVHKAGDTVEHMDKSKMKQQASNWLSDISQRAQDFDSDMKDFIKERPLTVLLGAIAVGFVASKLISAASVKKAA
jgi:hypothetical protein